MLEFNCRLGDPETQVVLPRMDTDLVDLIEAGVSGSLGTATCDWSTLAAVNVVLAARGYPDRRQAGDPVRIPALDEGELVFHAGTTLEGKAAEDLGRPGAQRRGPRSQPAPRRDAGRMSWRTGSGFPASSTGATSPPRTPLLVTR